MINEPGTRILYDGGIDDDYTLVTPAAMSVVRTIRDKQKETQVSGAFEREVNGFTVHCTYHHNQTKVDISRSLPVPEEKPIPKVAEEIIQDIVVITVMLVETDRQRLWIGASGSRSDYNIIISGAIWDHTSQEMSEVFSRELTSAEDSYYQSILYGEDQALVHNYLISLVPEAGIKGTTALTEIERVNIGIYVFVSPYDLYNKFGPKWNASMPISTPPTTPGSYMREPINGDTVADGRNRYRYAEYCWSFPATSTDAYPTSGDSSTYDTESCNDYIVIDSFTGHDWRIDCAGYQELADGNPYQCHWCQGYFRATLDGTSWLYDVGKFSWDTRFGQMFNGTTLLPGFAAKTDWYGGPMISDRVWSRAILKMQPWLYDGVIFDAVALFSGVCDNFTGRPSPTVDRVDTDGFWNIRGLCGQYDGERYLTQNTSDLFTAGIGTLISSAVVAGGATVGTQDDLPEELFDGITGVDPADFRTDSGLIVCNRGIVAVDLWVFPTTPTVIEVD